LQQQALTINGMKIGLLFGVKINTPPYDG